MSEPGPSDGAAATPDTEAPEARAVPRPALPAHVTTPLLTQITQQSLDLDYQVVADRRRTAAQAALARGEEPAEPVRRRVSVGWLAAVVTFGLLLAVAAVQTSRNAPVEELGRGALVKRITEQRDELAADQDRMTRLRSKISDIQDRRTRIQNSRNQAAIHAADVGGLTGYAATTGAGVVVEMTDGPDADTNTDQAIRDADIAHVVNGLWEAGATAVSVNGVRLTALSAIRNSNQEVRIHKTAVRSPYLVQALGDPEALSRDYAISPSAQLATATGDRYGFSVTIRIDAELDFPSAGEPVLLAASTLSDTQAEKKRSAG